MPEKKKVELAANQLIGTYRNDQARMEGLQRRRQSLQQVLNEIIIASEAIKEVQKAKKDENMLVSLGAGVYAEAKIANIKTVKNSMAGSVLVDTETGKALSKLQGQIKQAQKDLAGLQTETRKTAQNMQGIAAILQQGQIAAQKAKQESQNSEASNVT